MAPTLREIHDPYLVSSAATRALARRLEPIFEAVHGSAPDIAGKGVANPLALLMSAVMMLNHLADTRGNVRCRELGERIKSAYNRALTDGQKTRDLGGELGTKEFASAVIDRLG